MAVLFCKSSFYSLFFVWWYFFGRKDAFPGADGSTITQVTGADPNAEIISIYDSDGATISGGSITGLRLENVTTSGVLSGNTSQIYTIKNPMTFIYSTKVPKDWYTDDETYQNDVLWGNGEKKSSYDPCPVGWRVPNNSSTTYGDFSMETMPASGSNYTVYAGRTYANMSWFPAAGGLFLNSFSLSFVGDYGCYWSASAGSTVSAKRLYFSYSTLNPSATSYRMNGYVVRCIQK